MKNGLKIALFVLGVAAFLALYIFILAQAGVVGG